MTGEAPPSADRTTASAASSPASASASASESASPWRRLAALTYEGLLLAAVLLLAGFVLAPLVASGGGARPDHALQVPGLPERVVLFAALFGVGALYFGWSWTAGRRTLPMKTWRIRLVSAGGGALDAKTALIRYFAVWIGPLVALAAYAALKPAGYGRSALWLLGLNYAWALVDPDRRFLHDRIAGTRIVATPAAAKPRPE